MKRNPYYRHFCSAVNDGKTNYVLFLNSLMGTAVGCLIYLFLFAFISANPEWLFVSGIGGALAGWIAGILLVYREASDS